MNKLITRASSINRALDEIGDKWCLLILQEVFWGINSFSEMLASTGVSRGVLTDRLNWLISVECLRKLPDHEGGKRMRYHLTRKSIDIYDSALMALAWERRFFSNPQLDYVVLHHKSCGKAFNPEMRCQHCDEIIYVEDVSYSPGPGATMDERDKKVRRRSSIAVHEVPSARAVYKNMIHVVGDRWTANVLALACHGLHRFDEFLRELPVATNILSDRLKFLVNEGVFKQQAYQHKPVRYEYHLTDKGAALFPWLLAIQQWGDKWCDPYNKGKPITSHHALCGAELVAEVRCSECGQQLKAHEVDFYLGEPPSS